MKTNRFAVLTQLALLILLLCIVCVSAQADDKTRILFIGNSYTGQIRNTVSKLLQASPEAGSIEVDFITPGGKTLAYHLQNPATTQRIREGNWDYIVLQDQSQTPAVFPKKFEAAARKLDDLIDSVGAKTVFYQTWGRRDGDKANQDRFPTYDSIQNALSENYRNVAKKCEGLLAPVGDTWARVRKEDPDLGRGLYKGDGSHPSAKGAYLAACVLYMTIFRQSPAAIEYKGGLSEEEADVILKALDISAN